MVIIFILSPYATLRINSHVYLLVRPDNKESTNAVLHSSGWIPVGTITKTKFKNYRTCERIEETV